MIIDGNTSRQISEITAEYARERNGAAAAANAVIECIVGAATPLIVNLFNGGTMQERLLFALVLTGACSTLSEDRHGSDLAINVTPQTLREAFSTFTRLTGGDIRPHVPKAMVEFAAKAEDIPAPIAEKRNRSLH